MSLAIQEPPDGSDEFPARSSTVDFDLAGIVNGTGPELGYTGISHSRLVGHSTANG
jgi:hypothetical protein